MWWAQIMMLFVARASYLYKRSHTSQMTFWGRNNGDRAAKHCGKEGTEGNKDGEEILTLQKQTIIDDIEALSFKVFYL